MAVKALLGLAQNAGRLVWGSTAVERAVSAGKVDLLVLAGDASPRLVRRIHQAVTGSNFTIPIVAWGTKQQLGMAIGKRDLGVIAVCDRGFAAALQKACT